MNNKFGIVLLVAVCVGLGIWLVAARKQAADRQREDAHQIDTLSNSVVTAQNKLDDEKNLNATLNRDLDDTKKKYESAILDLTNNFTQVSSNLVADDAALKASRDDVAKRDAKIADLQSQNEALDKKASELNSQIAELATQINDKQKQLLAAQGDKAFLEKELKKLMTDKAELERQFNDIKVLKAQVAKVQEELNIARRLEWIRQGLYANADQKGAQKLMQGVYSPSSKSAKSNYDLNVEVGSDGSVHVIPPLTNAPAATPPK